MFMQKKIYILLHVYTPDIRTNLYNTCLALHQGVVITYLFWVYIYSTQYTTSSERGWAWRSPNKKTTCVFRPWYMKTFGQIIYSDFTRPHSKWWFFVREISYFRETKVGETCVIWPETCLVKALLGGSSGSILVQTFPLHMQVDWFDMFWAFVFSLLYFVG